MSFLVILWGIIVSLPLLLWTLAYHYSYTLKAAMPYNAIKSLLIAIRAVTVLATFILFYELEFHTLNIFEWLSSPLLVLFGVVMIAFGSWINYLVYKVIGVDGVYYGCELKAECKRVNQFPYSYTYHPQYIGCVIILIGVMLGIGFRPDDMAMRRNVFLPLSYMIFLYVLGIIMESYPPMSPNKK